jgi:hypothetical protein
MQQPCQFFCEDNQLNCPTEYSFSENLFQEQVYQNEFSVCTENLISKPTRDIDFKKTLLLEISKKPK